jgi:hypothetical protein
VLGVIWPSALKAGTIVVIAEGTSDMPKPISMTIQVEEVAFGKVWRSIDAMPGVISIQLKGDGPKSAAPQSDKGKRGSIQASVLQTLLNGAMSATDLGGGSRISGALHHLKKKKLVSKTGNKYKVTTAGMKLAKNGEGK